MLLKDVQLSVAALRGIGTTPNGEQGVAGATPIQSRGQRQQPFPIVRAEP